MILRIENGGKEVEPLPHDETLSLEMPVASTSREDQLALIELAGDNTFAFTAQDAYAIRFFAISDRLMAAHGWQRIPTTKEPA